MWILVVGQRAVLERPEGAVATLRDLGCRVQTADLWDALDAGALGARPPAVVLVEANDEADAARAALLRLRAVTPLADVPILVAVTVAGGERGRRRPIVDEVARVLVFHDERLEASGELMDALPPLG